MTVESRYKQLDKLLDAGKLETKNLEAFFNQASDIHLITNQNVLTLFVDGMISREQYNRYVHAIVTYLNDGYRSKEVLSQWPTFMKIHQTKDMVNHLLTGYVIFYVYGRRNYFAIDIAQIPHRTPEDSQTEVSLKGARDGFTEELHTNLALIRKRIRTEKLKSEVFQIGRETETKTVLVYLEGKAKKNIIEEVRRRIENVDVESLISAGQLEQWISDKTFSVFPLLEYTTRPDFASECLLRGRLVIIVEGSPTVLIGPMNLFGMLKSPEDIHFPYYIVAFQRLLRVVCLFIAIFVPSFFLAISNINIDQLPYPLIATIVISRHGLPFSLPLESFLILMLFELLREAGVRMPTALGQTISIVGGIIIGDAAIRAGLASPTLLVVFAVAAVATFTLVNQSLTGTVTILRIYTMLFSTFLGVYGFALSLISIVIYLARLESFKVAYLEPVTSLNLSEFRFAFLVDPIRINKKVSGIVNIRRNRK
ncbi:MULTISPECIES: spore germination protein [Cytobacillus]|uniref:spore germination protein n=1 Tax=Cytobacillus TaxID=2675230 RepID=UPI00203F8AE7|nr:spore germination protein [Cytobacillus kochii]MCM3323470.1 spore germination protein [Cytobacillus kochii]MCM3345865.1 spore germination protein [Cytobacillus kochii]MDM5206215.1 spore germination protein [Cytobacillus kochii]